MERVIYILLSALLLIFGTLSVVFYIQKSGLEKKLINVEISLTMQNNALKQKELKLKEFESKKPEIIRQVATKYEIIEIPKENATCETELKAIKKTLKIYFEN